MCWNCTGLTNAPELPATKLADSCYNSMFQDCTGLTTAPELSATEHADYCYASMFKGCTGLKLSTSQDGNYPYEWQFKADRNSGLDYMFIGVLDTVPTPDNDGYVTLYFKYLKKEKCLTFNSQQEGSKIKFEWCEGSNVQYNKNSGSWTNYNFGDIIELNEGESVSFKGNGIKTNDKHHFEITGKVSASGCVDSLRLDSGGNFQGLDASCYSYMFLDCIDLLNSPTLSALNLAPWCYYCMFQGCSGITEAPILPATALEEGCYNGMFYGCTKLSVPPDIPAITTSSNCYSDMFYGCTSLKLSNNKSDNYPYEWKFKVGMDYDSGWNKMFGGTGFGISNNDKNGYSTIYSANLINVMLYSAGNSLELTEAESKDNSLNLKFSEDNSDKNESYDESQTEPKKDSLNLELFEDNSSESESYNNSSDLNKTESKPLYSADSLANDEDLTYSQDSLGSSGSNNNSLNSGDSSSISESSSSGRSGSSASIKTGSESLLMLLSYIGLFSGTLLSLRKRKDD